MDKNNLISPITKGRANLVDTFEPHELIDSYEKNSNIDIKYILKNTEKILLYECEETGYRFFYPFSLAGDGPFYEKLELIPWYYASWKWDYDIAQNYIPNGARVIDIGCGEGKFLAYLMKEKKCICEGLELNEKAQQIATENHLKVSNETIQKFSESNKSLFDIVTFFQVLEHISDVDSFLKSAIEVAKPGGLIILAVPNNEPYYLTYDKNHFLNLPPHHMGWWNQKSLSKLAALYGLSLVKVIKQPLEHYTSYTQNYLSIKLKLPKVLVKVLTPFFKVLFFLNRKNINGASIMAIYKKN
jgi:2-polyprenyl-3-methyl-5-hydroxy-6-metoxy-1,4-benzoquinol methylase